MAMLRVTRSIFAVLACGSALLLASARVMPVCAAEAAAVPGASVKAAAEPAVQLSESQIKAIKVEPAGEHLFPQEQRAVGGIDFNRELLTEVFTPYQGRILKAFASVGDEVKKDKTLFTIDSPDLLQAESTLIATAAVLELTNNVLERQRNLYRQNAAAQKDYQQAQSDQQAAEGAYRAARQAVRVFGKTEAEIDKAVSERKVDSTLVVPSPITGLITARNASPGLFVQPGNPPPVYIVADTSKMWMIANVPERDAPELQVGQEVRASVDSLPGKAFQGKIVTIGATVDPGTRRVFVRSEIANPNGELKAGMFATFTIAIAPPKRALAVPQEAVVREGDGTMTVWVAAGGGKFVRRTIKTGLTHAGFAEIADGLKPGELVATEGSLFIANQYANSGH